MYWFGSGFFVRRGHCFCSECGGELDRIIRNLPAIFFEETKMGLKSAESKPRPYETRARAHRNRDRIYGNKERKNSHKARGVTNTKKEAAARPPLSSVMANISPKPPKEKDKAPDEGYHNPGSDKM